VRHRRPTAARAGAGLLVAGLLVATTGIMPAGAAPASQGGLFALTASHRSTTTVPHPAVGGQYDRQATLAYLLARAPTNWNPHAAANADPAVASTLDTILGSVLPSVFTVMPGYQVALNTTFMTSARQISDDPQTIRYQINPQATWSDGTPITYQDFVYAWHSQGGITAGSPASTTPASPTTTTAPTATTTDPAGTAQTAPTDVGGAPFTPVSTAGYRQIASVSEVGGDPYAVSVVLSTPDPDWRSLFSLLLPAHAAETVGFDTGFSDPTRLLSGGPFEVQSAVPGVSLTLVRNPQWWGAPANLAQVQYLFEPDPGRVLPAFQQGQVGAGSVRPTPGLTAGLAKVPGLDTAVVAGPVWEHLDFNQANPLLTPPALRQAIMLAIDRSQLISATVGRADPAVKPLDSLLFVAGQPGYRNDTGNHGTLDVAGAKAALLAGGYSYQGGRLLTPAGQPVTLGITTDAGDPLHRAVAGFVVTALARIGITVTETDSSDLPATLRSGAFDLAVVTSLASPYLSQEATRYVPDALSGSGSANQDGVADPTIDALAAGAAAIPLGAARTRAYRRLDRALLADAVSLPLFQEPLLLAWDRTYLNVVPNAAPGGATWDIAQWGVKASS
jgi:peptide/nickel transport system substrate-binding protein